MGFGNRTPLGLDRFLLDQTQEKSQESSHPGAEGEGQRFLAALVFGIIASILWELRLEQVLQYYILFPILIAFFKPVHLPEFLLGFTLGMIYSFGGILPIIIGIILVQKQQP